MIEIDNMQKQFVILVTLSCGNDINKRIFESPAFSVFDIDCILVWSQSTIDSITSVDEGCGNIIKGAVGICRINPVELKVLWIFDNVALTR
jgi:hypothetical protein